MCQEMNMKNKEGRIIKAKGQERKEVIFMKKGRKIRRNYILKKKEKQTWFIKKCLM